MKMVVAAVASATSKYLRPTHHQRGHEMKKGSCESDWMIHSKSSNVTRYPRAKDDSSNISNQTSERVHALIGYKLGRIAQIRIKAVSLAHPLSSCRIQRNLRLLPLPGVVVAMVGVARIRHRCPTALEDQPIQHKAAVIPINSNIHIRKSTNDRTWTRNIYTTNNNRIQKRQRTLYGMFCELSTHPFRNSLS